MPPPPPSVAGRGRCILRFAAARDRCFSRRFLAVGLRPLAVQLPAGGDPVTTTVHMWVLAKPPRKPLLLLHGFGAFATWQWYPYLCPLIAAGFDPIVPDLVFFGNSCTSLPDRSDTFQARSIKAAMEAIGVTRFGLVGVSYVGFVGYRMAAIPGGGGEGGDGVRGGVPRGEGPRGGTVPGGRRSCGGWSGSPSCGRHSSCRPASFGTTLSGHQLTESTLRG